GYPAIGGGPGYRELAVGVNRLDPGGRDHHREGEVLTHDRPGQIPLRRQVDDVRRKSELAERLDVVLQGGARLRARDEGQVDRLRQPLAGAALRLEDRFEPAVSHDSSRSPVGPA